MSDNHVAEQHSDSGPRVGHDQSNADTESNTDTFQDQGERVDPRDGVEGDHEDGKSAEDTARDDMFVDCPDELTTFDGRQKEEEAEAAAAKNEDDVSDENQVMHQQQRHSVELRNGVGDAYSPAQLEEADPEKESILQEYQEERQTVTRGVLDLHCQLKTLTGQQNEAKVGDREVTDVPLREMIKECMEFVKTASEERSNSETTVSNLREHLSVKDREIEDLNSKLAQLMASNESLQASPEAQPEKDRNVEIVIDKMISSLASVVTREQVLDDTINGKIDYIEEGTAHLIEKYNQILYEIYQLGQSFSEEKVKCTNTKEKLSMAVTKGKALVQQRDSLKMSLADKSSELEKCLIELQEKSVALQAAELVKEELVQREDMVGSLQNSLEEKNAILEQVEEILSLAKPDENEMVDVSERLSWLVDERNTLKDAFLELCNVKEALSLVDLPEPVSSSDLESQMNWLMDSFLRARDDMHTLQEQISTIKEESCKYIDRLSVSLLLELQEKDYLLSELNDLRFEYDELVGKNNQISLEKDQIVNTLVDLCGLNIEEEAIDQISSNTSTIANLCFQVIKEQSGPFSRGSHIDAELSDRIQSLLYVRDQGLMLYEDILEEEMLLRSDVSKLSNELKVASEAIIAMKEERSSLLQDLERSEEKIAMLRDKLSMAVKKGKGLVQDRDNLKGLLNEKNSEIEQLKIDLQKQESAVSEYREEINRLSNDVESISKLEADLLEMKRDRNQFEQFLTESNNMLQKVMECIDGIVLPVDPVFDEPIEKVKWLAGYVSECQDAKVRVEQELHLEKEKVSVLEIKLAEAQATVKSLEQELLSSDDNVSQLAEEKTELERGKAKVEEELSKVKEKIAEVCSTTKSLEDALSQAEKDISILSEEKQQTQVSRVAAERELESEISSLGFKLNSCMDELAGKNGSLENRSLQLVELLNDLQVLMKDTTLFPRIKQCFERKCETLKNMNLVVNKIRDNVALTANESKEELVMEVIFLVYLFFHCMYFSYIWCCLFQENPLVGKTFLDGLETFEIELDNREVEGADIDTIISLFENIAKGFHFRNKHIADKFDEFSDSMDEFISPLHEKLLETETISTAIVGHMEIMKEKTNTMEKLKEDQENIIATLENNVSVLLSACIDSTVALQTEVDKNLGQAGSISDVKLNLEAGAQEEHQKNSKYVEATQNLMNASRKAQTLIEQFKCRSEQVDATIEDLQNKLKETTDAFKLVTDERDLNKNRVLELESDIQALQSACVQNACSELKDKSEGYHALEEKLEEKEAEISSMHNALLAKEEESSLLPASQMRDLFDKIDRFKIPIVESEEDDLEPHTSAPMKKLFYIIDSVTRLHNQINSVSHDKEKLQSILETKDLEIQDLKEEVKQLNRNYEDSKMIKNELSELTYLLEKIMDILGASEWVIDRKSKGVKELMPALEKHINGILSESENSKSKALELDIKLVGSQKIIDELRTKVKLLEDSLQDRTSQPDIVQERSIYEASSLASGSEITEVEEVGSLGKKPISPVPPAAHVRNMRKGSTDHLALDISLESDNLIKRADKDEDKGHLFKSLNTSGFVPKQGKLIADRIDGLWVSGGRVLMSRPRARLGLIGYVLILHMWLLVTIL
uniref:Myosin-11 n=1 Tax=Cajanus cajan TaxID=3821 RepID=A0A151U8R7_CAJCA|nr:hypothetical protein KK1_019925 [Cajanus cajan]